MSVASQTICAVADFQDAGVSQVSTRMYSSVLDHGLAELRVAPHLPTLNVTQRQTMWQALSSSERGQKLRSTVSDLRVEGILGASPRLPDGLADYLNTIPFHCLHMSHLRILHLSSIEVCTGWEIILSDAAAILEELSLECLSYATDHKVASAMPPLTALRTMHLSRRHSVEGINADLALAKLILGVSQKIRHMEHVQLACYRRRASDEAEHRGYAHKFGEDRTEARALTSAKQRPRSRSARLADSHQRARIGLRRRLGVATQVTCYTSEAP